MFLYTNLLLNLYFIFHGVSVINPDLLAILLFVYWLQAATELHDHPQKIYARPRPLSEIGEPVWDKIYPDYF